MRMSERVPAIKVLLLPKDTNALGTIFGGVILSHIDLASAVEARKTAPLRYVTKAMREVEFHAPVFLGDIVSFYTETLRVGRTSITVKVLVEVERWGARAGRAHQGHRGRSRARRGRPRRSTPHGPDDPEQVTGLHRYAARIPMIAAFAPATVSNVGCGFDVLGFALDTPGDVVMAEASATARASRSPPSRATAADLSRDPAPEHRRCRGRRRCSTRLGAARGIRLTIHKGMPLASGIGSSGASAVAAVVAVNELLGRPAPLDVLLECAMAGEVAGCGAAHPDNVAPALYGGFVLARTRAARRISSACRCPTGCPARCCIRISRWKPARRARCSATRCRWRDAVRQWGNVGALVAGLFLNDLPLVARALEDHVAEPKRAHLVPAFEAVKQAARAAGALGCSLSGSGPSIFALVRVARSRRDGAGQAMREAFARRPG